MDGEQQEGKVKPLDFHTTPSRGQERSELRYATHAPMMIKEVGGAMQSQWKDYIDTCNQLLYVLDVTNPDQLSDDCYNFFKVLAHPYLQANLKSIPIVLIFNKIDRMAAHDMVISEVLQTFRISEAMQAEDYNFHCLKVSAATGFGVKTLLTQMHLVLR